MGIINISINDDYLYLINNADEIIEGVARNFKSNNIPYDLDDIEKQLHHRIERLINHEILDQLIKEYYGSFKNLQNSTKFIFTKEDEVNDYILKKCLAINEQYELDKVMEPGKSSATTTRRAL